MPRATVRKAVKAPAKPPVKRTTKNKTGYLPTIESGHVTKVPLTAHHTCPRIAKSLECTVSDHPTLINDTGHGHGFESDDERTIQTPHCEYGVANCVW